MTRKLEPIEPERAVELYLARREDDASANTLQSHEYRLKHFIRWCDQENIENINELTGRRLYEFRLWRKEDGDLNTTTVRTQLSTLRAFIKFCESIEAVEDNLHEDIALPALKNGEGVRDVMLEADRAEEILAYLNRFEYASRKHLVFSLLWETAMRTGALHSLDVRDLDEDRGALRLRHRPDTGTSLKNGNHGERVIAITDKVCRLVSDWIEYNRPDVTDEYGRQPLVATEHGRILKGNIRNIIYRTTRPCLTQKECPCGNRGQTPSKCESSVSPHALRRGSITHHLKRDVPQAVVSDRADVSPSVLSEHYDRMSQEEKMEQRREYLDSL